MLGDHQAKRPREGCFVYVTLPGATRSVVAGRLRIDHASTGEVGRFVYDRGYLERSDALPLDPVEVNRLSTDVFTHPDDGGLFSAMRDAAPDAWGRSLIDRSLGASPAELGYLLASSDDRAGALGFGSGAEPPGPGLAFDGHVHLEELQTAVDHVVAREEVDDQTLAGHVARLMLHGTAMGGARPKAVIEHDGALWVAKFPRTDDAIDVSRLERATLSLAQECGLDVAQSRLADVAGRQVLLVRRFDRDQAEDGWYRHRMASALTVIRGSETGHGTWSYLDYADEVRRLSSRHRADLRELFSRITFNMLTNNDDDHPRNHAILSRDGSWAMSPAYDLVPRATVTTDRRLAMVVGREGRAATRSNVLSEHGRFMLDREEAKGIVDGMIDVIGHGWLSACRAAGMSVRDCEAVRMAVLNPGFDWSDERLARADGDVPMIVGAPTF